MYGLDYCAMVFGLTGAYLVGQSNRWGWLSYMIGSFIMAYIGLCSGLYGITLGCVIYLVLECRGFIKYSKTNRYKGYIGGRSNKDV